MKYSTKDYDDGCINFVVTETTFEERQNIWNWCNSQGSDKAMAGHYDHDPQVVSFLKDDPICEKFLTDFGFSQQRVKL